MDRPGSGHIPIVMSDPHAEQDSFAVDRDGTSVTVLVRGDWDVGRTDQIGMAISAEIARGPEVLALDTGEVTFIDSLGLRDLLAARQSATDNQVRLELRNPSPAVRDLLEVTRLLDVFEVS